MPVKNILRLDCSEQFFHVYNRGVAGMEIFRTEDDYVYFESIIERLLANPPKRNEFNREYTSFFGQVEIHSYCLMPNHFHFIIRQNGETGLRDFSKALCVSYAMYFNKKYQRRGPLFESRFKSIHVDKDEYLMHLSRYIHLNPLGFRSWDHSSYNDFIYDPRPWVSTEFILGMFRTKKHYIAFVDDYRDSMDQSETLSYIFGEE